MYDSSVVPVKTETFSGVAAKSTVGECVRSVVRRAHAQRRLTVGLLPSVRHLSANGALFCLAAATPRTDSAMHMHAVLLHAFCVENGIHVLKVDSQEKMGKLLGHNEKDMDFSFVLVHYPYTDPFSDSQEFDIEALSPAERELVKYSEVSWDGDTTHVIKLPEK